MHLNESFEPAPDGNCQFAAIADQLATQEFPDLLQL